MTLIPGWWCELLFVLSGHRGCPIADAAHKISEKGSKSVEVISSAHSGRVLRTMAKLLRDAPERSSFLVKDAPVRRSGGLSTTRVQR